MKPQSHLNSDTDSILKNSKILIIDDAEFSRLMLSELFRSNGFTDVQTAIDGLEGLEKTKQTTPDLVILDLVMPNMDGFEYCELIRKDKNFKTIPVLVQSAASSSADLSKAFKAGATDFISKPINADELLARIQVHLENRLLMSELTAYHDRVETELAEARAMQEAIIPSDDMMKEIGTKYNLDIAGHFEPSSEIGGDLWGLRKVTHSEVAIYNVDIAGHGVTAALNTFRLHTVLQEQKNFFSSPNLCLAKINNILSDLFTTGQYATMFYGIINIDENTLQYSCAGCPAPILITKDGKASFLRGEGLPVGAVKSAEYESYSVNFNVGDVVMLYSDALTETEDTYGNFISEEVLLQQVKKLTNNDNDSKSIVSTLVQDFQANIETGALTDDLTITAYKRLDGK